MLVIYKIFHSILNNLNHLFWMSSGFINPLNYLFWRNLLFQNFILLNKNLILLFRFWWILVWYLCVNSLEFELFFLIFFVTLKLKIFLAEFNTTYIFFLIAFNHTCPDILKKGTKYIISVASLYIDIIH